MNQWGIVLLSMMLTVGSAGGPLVDAANTKDRADAAVRLMW